MTSSSWGWIYSDRKHDLTEGNLGPWSIWIWQNPIGSNLNRSFHNFIAYDLIAYPIGSMGLVYLPTFDWILKVKYTMHGSYGIWLSGWWQLNYFLFSSLPGGNDPIWRAYLSNRLVQPPIIVISWTFSHHWTLRSHCFFLFESPGSDACHGHSLQHLTGPNKNTGVPSSDRSTGGRQRVSPQTQHTLLKTNIAPKNGGVQ